MERSMENLSIDDGEEDAWMENEAQWTFNNHLLVIHRLKEGKDLMIRVQLDVRNPLKRKKKLILSRLRNTHATLKYEKLTLLCFIYGVLGHGDSFCPVRLNHGGKEMQLGWDLSLHVLSRRASVGGSI
ncbi:hypothetical protein Godav_023831 [Gossypium davidsonii]|uniref:Zinc knuckle CX2CX4HX4C domain-containing protein n=1 Tax=Gossypium davidsonii TaxID=34287 RepID=A0A7J8SUN3_GOSDV|nr:hypothetical protein [Gossypium davidsonii]